MPKDRLIIVFGAGGDRDAGKRAEMGAVAARLADLVIVTDDNPRSEDPAAIRAAILAARRARPRSAGRREAIRAAIAEAGPGDIVLLAGKGHEQGQIVGGQGAAVRRRHGRAGGRGMSPLWTARRDRRRHRRHRARRVRRRRASPSTPARSAPATCSSR